MKAWKQREKMKMVKFEFSLKFIYVFCTPSVIPSRKYKLKLVIREKKWTEGRERKNLEMKRKMENAKNIVNIVSRIIHDVQGVPRNMTVGE